MAQLDKRGPEILPDAGRLITRPFLPGGPNFGGVKQRLGLIVDRILLFDPETRRQILDRERRAAEGTYSDIEDQWLRHFELARHEVTDLDSVEDPELALLIGAYLTQGYAYEAVSLTNPSIVPIREADDGRQRFVMSARAIGEGHISSIAFLSGEVSAAGDVTLDDRAPYPQNGMRSQAHYERKSFTRRLMELGVDREVLEQTLDQVPASFSANELDGALRRVTRSDLNPNLVSDAVKTIHWLAASNYEVTFEPDSPITRQVISPAAPVESGGMEDARFVRFRDDDGSELYYATYTAFDGRRVLPQLIRTSDFTRFRIATLSGPMATGKGLALFPRTVQGEYLALSRYDNESLFIVRSDDIRHWGTAELVTRPEREWEAIQTGNCGSPLETEAGWLMITHGVGPMRRYVLGALLLDIDEPTKVIGRLRDPLLEPAKSEMNGLVPNVVYSCGGMIHEGNLILPYGFADYGIGIAVGSVDQILDDMV